MEDYHYVFHKEHGIGKVYLPIRDSLFPEYIKQNGTKKVKLMVDNAVFEVLLRDCEDHSIYRNRHALGL